MCVCFVVFIEFHFHSPNLQIRTLVAAHVVSLFGGTEFETVVKRFLSQRLHRHSLAHARHLVFAYRWARTSLSPLVCCVLGVVSL